MKTIKIILLFISLFSIPSLYSKSMDLNGIISVKASTFQNESHKPEFTIDGDRSTRWSSDFADQQWLEYDFKHEVVLTGLSLFWETAFAKEYDILVSKDRKSWTTVFKTREGDGRSDHIKFASPRQIRYLKINFIKRGTEWGYSLWEVLFKTDKEPAGLGRRPTKQNPDAPMDDNKFLSEISEYSFRYFINEIGADNELIQDRMKDKKTFSTMAVGFHLPVLCAGAERGWISREEAATRTLRALRSFDSMKKFHGFFGHYYDIQNGKVLPLMSKMDDGADISETGFMMMGILTSMEYFNKENALEKEIRTLAQRLYENVEWDFMLKDKNGNTLKTLSWHWSPQFGFEIGQRIKSTMEISSMVTYLLAIASPTHPIPQENWDEGWASSYKFGNYMGFDFVQCPPLFAQQYPQVWLDFRFMKDRYANYFRSSTSSVLLNRKFCLETLYPKQDLWGLTFCDGPYGYGIYGFPPMVGAVIEDAAIAPTGAGASIIFTPKESISSMRYMYDNYKDRLWGKYGFYDAFSIQEDWFDEDYLAIDQGPITLMIENYISGFVWKYAMKNRYIRTGLDKAGFVAVIDDFEKSPFESYAKWSSADKTATVQNIDEKAREGHYALKLSADNRTEYIAEPALKDFTSYKYLSLWIWGANTKQIIIESASKKQLILESYSVIRSPEGWDHAYYMLPQILELGNISKVRFLFESNSTTNRTAYLDEIVLCNSANTAPIPAVSGLTASESGYSGEVSLKWNNQNNKNIFRYIIKYSTTPIENEADFEKCMDIPGNRHSTIYGSETGYTVSDLENGKTYYFAMKSEDKTWNTSPVSKQAQMTLPKNVIEPIIDNFEDGNLEAPFANWSASAYELSTVSDKAHIYKGRYAMKIKYDKKGDAGKWVYIIAEPNLRNFKKFHFLTMEVKGKVSILAKLWNSEDVQDEISIEQCTTGEKFSKLVFDLSKCRKVDKSLIKRILLFIEPGKTDISGECFIDEIKLE